MNAQIRNTAERILFFCGGQLDIVVCPQSEPEAQAEAHEIMMQGLREFGTIRECPCGCGLKNDICQAHEKKIKAKNDAIPF